MKVQIVEHRELRCPNPACEDELYTCDGCGEYFHVGGIVECVEDKNGDHAHYCDGCQPRVEGGGKG